MFEQGHAWSGLCPVVADESSKDDGLTILDSHLGVGLAVNCDGDVVVIDLRGPANRLDLLPDVHDDQPVLIDERQNGKGDTDLQLRVLRGRTAPAEVTIGA